MPEDLDAILARVAAGELSPEDAEPLVTAAVSEPDQPDARDASDAPDADAQPTDPPEPPFSRPEPTMDRRPQRTVRLQVTERGRPVVSLRIPVGLAGLAGAVVPGLSGPQSERIREALRSGEVGPILEVLDEDGDGVVISTE
ncbi:MAG: hypothetical protein H0V04_01095 [Chloroflexi bacterium]|nr:hypothetical protein [Chloroflexota bacterium]